MMVIFFSVNSIFLNLEPLIIVTKSYCRLMRALMISHLHPPGKGIYWITCFLIYIDHSFLLFLKVKIFAKLYLWPFLLFIVSLVL